MSAREDQALQRPHRRRSWIAAIAVTLGTCIGAAALVPIAPTDSRDEIFDIPRGTWARRMSGDAVEILPSEIYLVIGVKDVLVLKNSDDVPHMFGPTLLMPGQTLRLPFSMPSQNQFACTAHANGQLTIVVEPAPASAWARLRWRTVGALERTGR